MEARSTTKPAGLIVGQKSFSATYGPFVFPETDSPLLWNCMANGGAPPCCVGCGEFERTSGYCKLLAAPTLDNRRQLLTMPCNVQRLLSQRFRSYGEDVAQDAVLVWLSPQWNPEDIARSFGRAPRDARIWLTSWPYFYLGRTSVRRLFKERSEGD